jgi:AcrR family transcriptional regulator
VTARARANRREQLLSAASRAFARDGYHGTSTAAVAAEAGVSQPYIIQVFGTKEDLFVEVHDRAGALVEEQLRSILSQPFDAGRAAAAYADVLMDRTLLLIVLQGLAASSVPAIGEAARALFARLYGMLTRDGGATDEEARAFLANGMLLNALLAIDMREHLDEHPWVAPLIDVMLPEG